MWLRKSSLILSFMALIAVGCESSDYDSPYPEVNVPEAETPSGDKVVAPAGQRIPPDETIEQDIGDDLPPNMDGALIDEPSVIDAAGAIDEPGLVNEEEVIE